MTYRVVYFTDPSIHADGPVAESGPYPTEEAAFKVAANAYKYPLADCVDEPGFMSRTLNLDSTYVTSAGPQRVAA